MRIQVAIIGAGPAGLVLGHLLRCAGIETVVIEHRTRAHVESRVRAGILEQGTVNVLRDLGLDSRLRAEGLVHTGTRIVYEGGQFRIDFAALTDGSTVTVYGQQEVVRDLFDAAEGRGLSIIFGAENVSLEGLDGARPSVRYQVATHETRLDCDFVVGCDGAHGVCRRSIPEEAIRRFERAYPFGWLGILADVPPISHELIYANHIDGFALASMRSATRSRFYIQCGLAERVEDWPDERFWHALGHRLGPEAAENLTCGPVIERSIVALRSAVIEPMRFGPLFLAGDAAHIVPPTGAKGLNLAVSDVTLLARAFAAYFSSGDQEGIDSYSQRALSRIWAAERFSWWFTSLMHRFPGMTGFDLRMQGAELAYIRDSRAAQAVFAESYVGLPLE